MPLLVFNEVSPTTNNQCLNAMLGWKHQYGRNNNSILVMMKLLILYLCLASYSLNKDIEAGIAEVEFDHPSFIKFYNKPDDDHFIKSIELINNKETHSVEFKDPDSFRVWARPEFFKPDYYRLAFRCKTKTERWLEIIVNDETGETLWVKYDHSFKYEGWLEFLREAFTIGRNEPTTNPIYTKPDINSAMINDSGRQDFFKVKSIKGDWMEIYDPEWANVNENIASGWIKWKKDGKLLIHYYPFS